VLSGPVAQRGSLTFYQFGRSHKIDSDEQRVSRDHRSQPHFWNSIEAFVAANGGRG
jgi:hypothetical protein